MRKEQKKTGGGISECSELNSFEEKVMSMTQFGMLGMLSRIDNDIIESNPTVHNIEIEYLEDNGDDVLEILKATSDVPVDNGQILVNEAITEDLAGNNNTLRATIKIKEETKSKFIHRQKNENLINQRITRKLKKQVLQLQKECLETEKENDK
ncbi:hypothetical protein CBL_02992 [Carabus blaptoides fortunei]